MDFVTQITLGAAVGQATMNRDLGNKAVLWGMLGGAIPDLDVLANPLMDSISQLAWHRGISHGILFTVVLTPLLGWIIHRVHGRSISMEKSSLFAFLALSTHVLLDSFTVYGTGVFEPFSSSWVAFNNLFIIDPLYTVPLMIGVLASMLPGDIRRKLFRNAAGIIISTMYVVTTLLLKFATLSTFTSSLEEQKITYTRITTAPTPLNSLLWRAVAEDAGGYWVGYRSVFDKGSTVKFWRVPRNEQLLAGLEDERAVRTLRWFSNGWYTVTNDARGLLFHDLRFGDYDAADPSRSYGMGDPVNTRYVFSYRIYEDTPGAADRYTLEQSDFEFPQFGLVMETLWKRIQGTRPIPIAVP